MEDVNFILIVHHSAKKIWNGQDLTLTTWIAKTCRDHQARLCMNFADIVNAVTLAHREDFCIFDVNITVELPGTLMAQDLIATLKRAGYTIIESAACGLQCVKCIPPGHEGVIIKYQNEVLESVQQGYAQKSNIACKVAKLLTPITDGVPRRLTKCKISTA